MAEPDRILLVDDERNVIRALERLFLDDDYDILTASSGDEGLELLEDGEVQLILADYRMEGMDGVEFLRRVYERWPDTIRMVLSGYADTAAVVAAINEGRVYKFIPKPWNDEELRHTVARALETWHLQQHNRTLTCRLEETIGELRRLNEGLEEEVKKRTRDLEFQNLVLRRSQELLDQLPVAVVGVDSDGVVVQCNREVEALMGLSGGRILNRPVSQGLPPEVAQLFADKSEGGRVTVSGRELFCALRPVYGANGDVAGMVMAVYPLVEERGKNSK